MISGINTDIEYGGKIYHVQTEDGGEQNPVLVTHLFAGGAILSSQRVSYADLIKAGPNRDAVRELMKKQHHAMITNLTSNQVPGISGSRPAAPKPAVTAPSAPSLPKGRRSLDDVINDYLQNGRGRGA